MSFERVQFRAIALIVALSCVGAVASCGGDDDEGGSGATAAAERQPASGDANAASDEQSIKDLYVDYVDASYNGPPKAICEAMTTRARKTLALPGEGLTSCVKFYRQSLIDSATGNATYPKPKVLAVEVKGAKAIARVKTGDGGFERIRFTKEGDEWKVDGAVDTGPY